MASGVQGLDRATAPPAETARRMLDAVGGRWWNVYIGGPESGGHGWTPELVREYVRHGIDRFMLTYVGRQWHGPLTAAQGEADARDAVRIANTFGYGGSFPLCLDVEHRTYTSAPAAAVAYARAWCATVRSLGARPGVYANPDPLKAMHGTVPAEFVWVASWVSHVADQRDPRAAPHLPATLWPNQGQRAWQYAGAFGNVACRVLGLDVDINVADLECLAHEPGVASRPALSVAAHAPARRLVRRGETGEVVLSMTRGLAYVRSQRTGRPYLAGARRRFDAAAETALEAFQAEHHLGVDGVFGPTSAQALKRAVRLEQSRRRKPVAATPTRAAATSPAAPAGFTALLDRAHRLDAEADQAWKAVIAYGRGRSQVAASDVGLADVVAVLTKIEGDLATLIATERAQQAAPVVVASGTAVATAPTALAVAPAVAAGNGAGPPPPAPPRTLGQLTEDELVARVDRLDRALDRTRSVLIARYARHETTLAATAPPPSGGGGNGSVVVERQRPPAATTGAAPTPVGAPHRIAPTPAVRNLQRLLNQFTAKHLKGVPPLVVDGKKGPQTKQRIRAVKYYLGYAGPGAKSTAVDPTLVKRLRHPRRANPATLSRATRRKRAQQKATKRSSVARAGVTTFDGKPVAAWMKPYLDWARAHGWTGTLNSGWRDPIHSQQLCKEKCGQVKCPGTCAGLSSNHVGRIKPAGAIDVSDPQTFDALMRRCPLSPRLVNHLSRDRVHFSVTGH